MGYYEEVLADGPVAYFRMGDASSPLIDETGNRDGTGHGLTYSQAGIPGGGGDTAISNASASDYVDFSSIPAAWNVGDTFTLEVWAKFVSLPGTGYFIWGGATSFTFRVELGPTVSLLQGTSNYIAHFGLSLDTNWHHLVATKSGSTTHLYHQGIDVTVLDSDFTITNPASDMSIFNASGAYVDGTLDEVAIYPTALSAARVLVHYNEGSESSGTGNLAPVIYGRGAC